MKPSICAAAAIANGNTFASIVALVIRRLNLPAEQAYIVRSLASHIVAGVATAAEVTGFREFCDELES